MRSRPRAAWCAPTRGAANSGLPGAFCSPMPAGNTVCSPASRWCSRHPPSIATRRLLLTAFALSIDNLVVGFSLGVQHTPVIEAVVAFAVASVGLTLLGLEFGRRLATVVGSGSQYLAGVVLVGVGILVAVGEL